MSTLNNIFTKSFASQNLIEISIVEDCDENLPFYKPKFFNFISIYAGEKNQSGQRTFNRQNKIVLKCDYDKLLALAYACRLVISGTQNSFSIMSDSSKAASNQNNNNAQGGFKTCFPSMFTQKTNNGDIQKFSLSFKAAGNPFGNSMSIAEGRAMADIIEHIGKHTMKLTMSSSSREVGTITQRQTSKPYNNNKYQNNNNNQYQNNNNNNQQQNYQQSNNNQQNNQQPQQQTNNQQQPQQQTNNQQQQNNNQPPQQQNNPQQSDNQPPQQPNNQQVQSPPPSQNNNQQQTTNQQPQQQNNVATVGQNMNDAFASTSAFLDGDELLF